MTEPETSQTIIGLAALAAVMGMLHTVAGPDHYVPFVMMARAKNWSRLKTGMITALCGFGHVMSSVILGGIGIAAGIAISGLETIESSRGDLAAWLMIAFGLAYGIWGLKRVWRSKPHEHSHPHRGGVVHTHHHSHTGEHVHVHQENDGNRSVTPWVLFTIFVFGPCECLIPILMYPAAEKSLGGTMLVVAVFALATIATMLVMVYTMSYGFAALRFAWIERHSHSVAGFTIALCGLLILAGL